MKKTFMTVMLAVACLLTAMPAQAQLLKWGVKGGVNLSKLDWDGGYSGNKDNTTGFFIGPMAEMTIPIIGLGVDAAAMFSQRGKDDYKEQGLEIPIHLKYTIGLGSMLGIYVAAGPDFFFNFKDVDWADGRAHKKQVAINVGAGLKLLSHLQLGITYNIPTKDSFEREQGSARTKSWQVSAAYLF